MMLDNYGTWLEIDLAVIKKNFSILCELAGTKVMPVVKANAYGHGLERVAIALQEAGAEWFGVARIEEALLLREVGIKAKILVLGFTPPMRISHAIKEDISLAIYDRSVAKAYAEIADRLNKKIKLHIKVETGMGRLGVPVIEAVDFISEINSEESFFLEGVFTHFACADEPEKDVTACQMNEFNHILQKIEELHISPEFVHAANSAGTINYPTTRLNIVRTGIALYGHEPSDQTVLPNGIHSAISWKTRLISIKELPSAHGVSYGHKYHTKGKETIGVIAVGYGDGFRRQPGNFVLLHGVKVPIIGNVCMDQCMIKLEGVTDPKIGDEVVILGKQEDSEITSSEIAGKWGTINYEVLCGLAARMPRNYLPVKK